MSVNDVASGTWWDHGSSGCIWQLTLQDTQAFIFLIFLTLIFTWSLHHFWPVARFVCLHWLCRPLGRHLKELRKTGCETCLWKLVGTFYDVRKSDRRHLWRWAVFLLINIFYIALYIGLPAVVTYGLTYQSIEIPTVRTSGRTCILPEPSAENLRAAVTVRNANTTLASSEYHQSCYEQNTLGACLSSLAVDRLEMFQSEAECPFSASVCRETDVLHSRPVRFETPALSLVQLGINANSALHLKRGMTCAVIQSEEFTISPLPNAVNVEFTLQFGESVEYAYEVRNLTYIAPGYRLITIPQLDFGASQIDPRLARPDGFVTVIMLQAPGVYFPLALDDLMFAAHQDAGLLSGGQFLADSLINVAACVDQYQVCSHKNGACSEWESPEAVATSVSRVIESSEAELAWMILSYSLSFSSIHYTVAGRGASALKAQRFIFSQNQEALQHDQWRRELETWFGISLAKLQFTIAAIATTTPFLSMDLFDNLLDQPRYAHMRQICTMIRFRAGDFTNINFTGCMVIFVVSIVLLLIRIGHKALNLDRHLETLGDSPAKVSGASNNPASDPPILLTSIVSGPSSAPGRVSSSSSAPASPAAPISAQALVTSSNSPQSSLSSPSVSQTSPHINQISPIVSPASLQSSRPSSLRSPAPPQVSDPPPEHQN